MTATLTKLHAAVCEVYNIDDDKYNAARFSSRGCTFAAACVFILSCALLPGAAGSCSTMRRGREDDKDVCVWVLKNFLCRSLLGIAFLSPRE